MKWLKIFFLILVVSAFFYLRITPIINGAVPYTYDQGRDFMKVAEMIRNHRPTFIGPTTGIMGLFHGAWWYYLMAIPSLLFKGLPIGFYVFMLFIGALANFSFAFFIKKRMGDLSALFFLSVTAFSPYFIPLAFTASNNIIVPYLILSLIVLIFALFDKKTKDVMYFLVGLNLAFILEFEVAFGLFMIPAFIITTLMFKETRSKIYKIKKIFYLLAGLIIPVVPRGLFEIKNHFLQTKTLLSFFLKPKLHNPKPFLSVLSDRVNLFIDYAKGLFAGNNIFILLIVVSATIVILMLLRKKNKYNGAISFITVLISLLFIISLYYKDNFWFNYYEGIQYLFLILVVSGFYLLEKQKRIITLIIFIIFLAANLFPLFSTIKPQNKEPIGLKEAEIATQYVYQQGKGDYFCLRIYTPPVIPYTYDYLLDYYAGKYHIKYPKGDFVDNKCWFIIESDSYQFRVDQWRKNNIPEGSLMIKKNTISKNVTIEEWQLKAD